MYTIVPCSFPRFCLSPSLQLADEETGGEQAHALGQNVLGEDVDERWQQNEGHGGLVDEEEGDELRHRRLEDCHLLRSNLSLLVLARCERRARHHRWADGGGRAESGPGEGAEETGVHVGLWDGCFEARGDER